MPCPAAVLKRWSCLSAPVATRYEDEGCAFRSAPALLLLFDCFHGSTDATKRLDSVGVCIIVGFDGAWMSYSQPLAWYGHEHTREKKETD